MDAAIPFQRRSSNGTAAGAFGQDLYEGIASWRLWTTFGWNDIRQRYRRSVLGPFWMTISMSVLIIVLGFLYSRIFHADIETYLPYLALGFICWGFISSSISETCEAFRESERIIKQIKIPFSMHIFRVVWRNLIVFFHTAILFVPIALFFGIPLRPVTLLVVPGLALLFINLTWLGLTLAILSTRFRDVPPIVATLLQITMFATPIMWPVSAVGDQTFIININPVYHLIELVRTPLLGDEVMALTWIVAVGMAVVGWLTALILFRRVGHQIVYWL